MKRRFVMGFSAATVLVVAVAGLNAGAASALASPPDVKSLRSPVSFRGQPERGLAYAMDKLGAPAEVVCEEILVMPGSHEADSSLTDQAIACLSAAGRLVGSSPAIQNALAGFIGAQASVFANAAAGRWCSPSVNYPLAACIADLRDWFFWRTASDISVNLGTWMWDLQHNQRYVEAPPSPQPAPGPVPVAGPTDEELNTDRIIRAVPGTDPDLARQIARQCEAERNVVTAVDPCQNEPIFVPGGGDAGGAAYHDLQAIAGKPAWFRLTYVGSALKEAQGLSHRWYEVKGNLTLEQKTACSPARGPREVQCDEYPFFSAAEGFPTPGVSLREVPAVQNEAEGRALSGMYRDPACNMGSSDGVNWDNPGSGTQTFLVVPLVTKVTHEVYAGPASTHICGGGSGGGGVFAT